ncbi:MAG TPA: hypothetical protein VKB00_02120 [Candidatus Limnocylindrales bacterium]|nr:hypothetical protein [Candidatus Limnocylindrales bacterium]
MTIDEWDESGLEPRFGHQRQWLKNDLDRLQTPAAAAFALLDRAPAGANDSAPSQLARRFLVATELGLLDASYRPEGGSVGRLASTVIPWPDVRGLRIEGTTVLDDAFRHVTRWSLVIEHPAVEITEPPDDEALIDLWRECVLRAGRPPTEKPKEPQ